MLETRFYRYLEELNEKFAGWIFLASMIKAESKPVCFPGLMRLGQN
ncbi:hypothetical protein AB3U99_06330 [Niallia sp. JL1B1071]